MAVDFGGVDEFAEGITGLDAAGVDDDFEAAAVEAVRAVVVGRA